MAGGYSVRVLVSFFFFLLSLCHSKLSFFVIFMFKYDFIDIFHFTFYSGVLVVSDRKVICSQAREIVGGLNRTDSGEATEIASECGSTTCSLKTPSEIEMFI